MNLHLLHKKHKLFALIATLGLVAVLVAANITQTGQGQLRFFNDQGEEVVLDTETLEKSPYAKVLTGDLGDLQIKNVTHQWNESTQSIDLHFMVYNIPQPGATKSVDLSTEDFTVELHASAEKDGKRIHFIKTVESSNKEWIPAGGKLEIVTNFKADAEYTKLIKESGYKLESAEIHIDTKNQTPEWDEMNNKKSL